MRPVTITLTNVKLSNALNATATDVFRALAAAIGVRVTIDPSLQGAQVGNVAFKNALTVDVLTFLCNNTEQLCEWDFDVARGLCVTKKRKGRALRTLDDGRRAALTINRGAKLTGTTAQRTAIATVG